MVQDIKSISQVSFITNILDAFYFLVYNFVFGLNEHFSRQHTTQTNKLRLKLKLKKISTILPYSSKEKMNTFCENNAKIYVNLPVPNKFRRPSFFFSTLNTEYSIFITQNKKIIIIKQLKTVNLFFI
jgi:hypothetical protein